MNFEGENHIFQTRKIFTAENPEGCTEEFQEDSMEAGARFFHEPRGDVLW